MPGIFQRGSAHQVFQALQVADFPLAEIQCRLDWRATWERLLQAWNGSGMDFKGLCCIVQADKQYAFGPREASASISKQSASKISKWLSPSCLPPSCCGGEDMAQAPLSTLLGSQVNEITALLTRLTDAEVRREYHRSSGWEIVGDDGRW